MGIVVEATELPGRRAQRLLAGMAEGRVAEIVRQRHRLGQILVQRQHPRDRARDLGHLERMGQPGAVIVAFVLHEDLGLVLETAKGGRMDDPVAVALVGGAGGAFRLAMEPAAACLGPRRGRRKRSRRLENRAQKTARRQGLADFMGSTAFAPAATRTT